MSKQGPNDITRKLEQLNQYLDPFTEQRAIACSTNDLGINATSSNNTPPNVIP